MLLIREGLPLLLPAVLGTSENQSISEPRRTLGVLWSAPRFIDENTEAREVERLTLQAGSEPLISTSKGKKGREESGVGGQKSD